jgi:hypothetical protein
MTSALRKAAAIAAIIVGLVFASTATRANAASLTKVTKTHLASAGDDVGIVSPADWWW